MAHSIKSIPHRFAGRKYNNAIFGRQELVRDYLSLRPSYELLCGEVRFILEHNLSTRGIETAHLSSRIKTTAGFLDKIERKRYRQPFAQCSDILGVRIVCFFPKDISKIAATIASAFTILEHSDKGQTTDDSFGYKAEHFIVRLKRSAGARWKLLNDISCEIQVRTIMQDAWAMYDHVLRYKRERQIPFHLRRALMSLAAVLENADKQFEKIQHDRGRYASLLQSPRTSWQKLLREETNQESLYVYLRRKFPRIPLLAQEYHNYYALFALRFDRYPTIAHIDAVIEKTATARRLYADKSYNSCLTQFALAFGCVDKEYRRKSIFSEDAVQVFKAYSEA